MIPVPLWLSNRPVLTASSLALRDVWTQETLAHVAQAGPAEIERAITAAEGARAAMAALPGWRRREVLDHLRQRILENAEGLAKTLSAECGKPITAARMGGPFLRLVQPKRHQTARSAATNGTKMKIAALAAMNLIARTASS